MSECAAGPEPVEIIARGDRGFHGYGAPVKCCYRTEVTVYESSSAEGPHVWLKLKEDPAVLKSGGEAVAHLNEEQARAVIARLQAWLDEIPSRWER